MTLVESPLIARLHDIHTARGLDLDECLLCVEARQKAEKAKPAWLAHLTARELTTRRTLA